MHVDVKKKGNWDRYGPELRATEETENRLRRNIYHEVLAWMGPDVQYNKSPAGRAKWEIYYESITLSERRMLSEQMVFPFVTYQKRIGEEFW